MRPVRMVILCFAASWAALVEAQDWIQIGSSQTDKLSVDPGTIKKVSGSIRSAWFQFDKTSNKSGVSLSKEFDRINCDEESIGTVSVLSYRPDGTVVSSITNPIILLQYEPAPPGTFAAKMVGVVCSFDLG